MDVAKLAEFMIAQGGFAVLALLMFAAYRKDVRGTADVLIVVVKENTAAFARLTTLMEAFHDRLDNENRGSRA